MPYPTHIVNQLKQAKQDFRNWYNRAGSPTDPADNSDPRFDYLAHKTLHDYLTVEKGFHPAVSDFYTRFAVDALCGTSQQVNAYTSISFIAAEHYPVFTLPGGTSGIARHILNWLIPAAINGNTTDAIISNPIIASKLDLASNLTRVRQLAMVVRADTSSSGSSVVYFKDNKFYRANAGAVIMAGQNHTAQHIVEHLLTPAKVAAFNELHAGACADRERHAPNARPLVDLGLGYNQYWWGSKFWADFAVADWIGPNRHDPNRQTVLTFYGANELPPEDMRSERVKLLSRPFSEYENSLREDLERIFVGTGFDFDCDVSAVYLYRWGHGMVYPKVGFPFGRADRAGRPGRPHARGAAHRPRGDRPHLVRRAGRRELAGDRERHRVRSAHRRRGLNHSDARLPAAWILLNPYGGRRGGVPRRCAWTG